MVKLKPRATLPGKGISPLLFSSGPTRSELQFWTLTMLLLAFVVTVSYCHIRSLDLWWHLKTGEWVWQHRSIPSSDPFSYSAAGKPWISHEWLFGLIMYLAWRAGDVTALVGVKAALIGLLFLLAAWTAHARRALPGMLFLALAAAHAIARFRFTERPELFSVSLAVAFILVHETSREKACRLVLLPFLQVAWANIHGGTAIVGWALAGALFLDVVWESRREGISWQLLPRQSRFLWQGIALAGVVAGSFVNPHGARTLFYGLLRTESPLDNKEFQSLFRMMDSGIEVSLVLFLAFAALLGFFFVLRPRSVRGYEWLLFPVLLAVTVVFYRFRPLFVFLFAPTLAWQLSRGKWLGRLRPWLPALAAACLMAHTATLEARSYFYRFGPGVHRGIFPQEGVDFLKRHSLAGRMFNTYGIGGYLIWSLWPEQRVFIDGREDVYLEPGVLEEYIHCFDSRDRWQALVDKYSIDFAIVRYPEQAPARPEQSLDTLAFPRQDWGLAYFDDVVAIYVRRNGRDAGLLKEGEIKIVQPLQLSAYLDGVIRDPGQLRLFLEEMTRHLEEHPESFRDHFNLGMLAVKRGPDFLNIALQEFEQAALLNPEYTPAWINLGGIYLHLGRISEAERAYRKVLAIEKNPLAAEQLRRIRRM